MSSPLKLLPAALLSCSLTAHAQVTAPAPTPTPATSIARGDIEHTVAQLRTDPTLGHLTTTRRLRWDNLQNKQETPKPNDGAAKWLLDFFDWLTSAARLLVWVAGAIIAACIGIWIWRLVQTRQGSRRLRVAPVATHIQDLDIRPASLPGDIGAAALAELESGNTRKALSLLYRGALSRAVHRFSVSIGEAFTESESLRAVKARLDTHKSDYFAALVYLWQLKVYAALEPPPADVAALCKRFSSTFDVQPV